MFQPILTIKIDKKYGNLGNLLFVCIHLLENKTSHLPVSTVQLLTTSINYFIRTFSLIWTE
jgi:hypothetical protein